MSTEIAVSIEDTEFTIGEIQEFLDTARSIDGVPANALVVIKQTDDNPATYTLTASTAYRSKAE